MDEGARQPVRQRRERSMDLPELDSRWAFFLDIDGTLLEHAGRPDAAQVDAPLGRLLAELDTGARGALALISGRSVSDIDALFAPLKFPAAGQHGIERRDARGDLHRHAFPLAPMRQAAKRLAAFASLHPALILEDKGLSLSLHYRQAPKLAGKARAEVTEVARALGEGFEMHGGKMVFEIKPSGRDKGTAIEEFMQEAPFLGRVPVFLGDDHTDEYGFGVVNRLGGHAVKVGEGDSAARWRIADAPAVRAWLAGWVERFRGS